jgi:hypothetical protein
VSLLAVGMIMVKDMNMNSARDKEPLGHPYTRKEILISFFKVIPIAIIFVACLWWLFSPKDSREVFVIQGVNDACFRRLEATTANGPDEWSMKVCISANNGYVDKDGKVINP